MLDAPRPESLARTSTVAFEGLEARRVEVQCAITPGLPAFSIVGLPDKAVSEARDRVLTALNTMAIALPSKRVTINLSPADLPKIGSHFDLPIALALLAALGVVPREKVEAAMSFSWPSGLPAATMPTTPPAGPDRMASFPRNAPTSASPPFDCMKRRLSVSGRPA